MGKKILVTGANGYIGRHVVNELCRRGHNVIAADLRLDDIPENIEKRQMSVFTGDTGIYQILGSPEICIHLAWRDGFIHNSPQHMLNLSKHYEFVDNMIAGGCQNMAIMGTMHEVGYWEGAICSDTPCNPSSLYGIAKNALRQSIMLLSKDKDVNLYWMRAYYIVGDDTKNSSIFAKILKAHSDGKKEFPFTSGKNQYDFISVEKLAHQIAEVCTQDQYTGIINVCSGKPVSLAERVEQFIKENHLDITLQYGKFPDRAYDSPIVYGDNRIIERIEKNIIA